MRSWKARDKIACGKTKRKFFPRNFYVCETFLGIRTSNKQKGAKESMKYPDISKAVEQEILASYEKLYRLAFSYVKNEQDAMDVVQESVYKAMKNASQIKEKKYIKTWLWRIVINTAVDATRRQSRFVSDDQVQEEGQEDRYEDTDIMVALDTLEEKERKVIMLKVFEEWTIREIADCLHENPNTGKSMLYRGLKKLRGKVEAEMV